MDDDCESLEVGSETGKLVSEIHSEDVSTGKPSSSPTRSPSSPTSRRTLRPTPHLLQALIRWQQCRSQTKFLGEQLAETSSASMRFVREDLPTRWTMVDGGRMLGAGRSVADARRSKASQRSFGEDVEQRQQFVEAKICQVVAY